MSHNKTKNLKEIGFEGEEDIEVVKVEKDYDGSELKWVTIKANLPGTTASDTYKAIYYHNGEHLQLEEYRSSATKKGESKYTVYQNPERLRMHNAAIDYFKKFLEKEHGHEVIHHE